MYNTDRVISSVFEVRKPKHAQDKDRRLLGNLTTEEVLAHLQLQMDSALTKAKEDVRERANLLVKQSGTNSTAKSLLSMHHTYFFLSDSCFFHEPSEVM